jgi:glucose-6-phosphate dehydrogenase assembly protein OpcA
VEKAVSDANVERFRGGLEIAVDPTAIEGELATLWRKASQGCHVTRAALWNLVIRADGDEPFARAKKLVDQVTPSCPARVLVLRADTPGEGAELEARIEANFASGAEESRLLGSEEVSLLARNNGRQHFPGLVRSLLLPDLPSALVWIGAPPQTVDEVHELLEGMDRMIFDTGDLASDLDLLNLAPLVTLEHQVELADIGWLRLGPIRLLLASFFDPPVGAEPLFTARRVRLDCARHGAPTALLLLGWLACRLGWGQPERARSGGGRSWKVPRPGGQVALEMDIRNVDAGRDGIYELVIESQSGAEFGIRDAGPGALELRGTGLPTRVLSAPERSDVELLIAALGRRGHDPMFGHALACAAELGGE